MKKFVFCMLSVFVYISAASAQDCMMMYPDTKGSTMVTQSYDANDNLMFKTNYVVQESVDYPQGPNTNMTFSVMDNQGNVVDQGKLDAYCNNGDFYMKSVNRSTCPEVMKVLATANTELMGSYLDYPDTFNDNFPFQGDFKMDGAEFTVKDKGNSKDFMKVRVYGRNYDKNEKITTPAGTFDAAKINFNVEVYDNETKETKTYKNTEWYAVGAGIVRTEVRDNDNNLMSYTVLSTLDKK